MLKQASRVFNNRQQETVKEYKILLERKQQGSISAEEEKKFVDLYRRLVSYGFIEKIPERLLKSDFEKAIDDLIKDVENYVKKEGKNE